MSPLAEPSSGRNRRSSSGGGIKILQKLPNSMYMRVPQTLTKTKQRHRQRKEGDRPHPSMLRLLPQHTALDPHRPRSVSLAAAPGCTPSCKTNFGRSPWPPRLRHRKSTLSATPVAAPPSTWSPTMEGLGFPLCHLHTVYTYVCACAGGGRNGDRGRENDNTNKRLETR